MRPSCRMQHGLSCRGTGCRHDVAFVIVSRDVPHLRSRIIALLHFFLFFFSMRVTSLVSCRNYLLESSRSRYEINPMYVTTKDRETEEERELFSRNLERVIHLFSLKISMVMSCLDHKSVQNPKTVRQPGSHICEAFILTVGLLSRIPLVLSYAQHPRRRRPASDDVPDPRERKPGRRCLERARGERAPTDEGEDRAAEASGSYSGARRRSCSRLLFGAL